MGVDVDLDLAFRNCINARVRNIRSRSVAGKAADALRAGLSFCSITPETINAYAGTILALDNASIACLEDIFGTGTTTSGEGGTDGTAGPGGDGGSAGGTGRGGRWQAVECGGLPPCRIQLTFKMIEDGPVLCGLCGDLFEPGRRSH